ncbi:MAG: Fic family protein [Ruminococcus sp.]|nr:Fic family protein [Ruminococcus sp.]
MFPKGESAVNNNYPQIQELLHQRADFQARLNLLPYDGNPEVKDRDGKKYLYIRKRVGSRLTSTYVGDYSDELYQLLLRNAREARELRKNIRRLDKELALLGYSDSELSERVMLNLDFARANMKSNIYDQAVLEGVATTFPQTEDIIENGKVNGMSATDVQKILNLKHSWEFILDKDVISYPSDYSILCHIAKLVNEGFYQDGGRIRGVPVTIGGTSYVPPLPIESVVKESIEAILEESLPSDEKAITLCLYCMKAQIFNDGNKRASVIFANHYMISQGAGMIIIPEKEVPEFKRLLVAYYEDKDNGEMMEFMKAKCIKTF